MTVDLPPARRDELDERRLRLVAEQATSLRWQVALTAAVVVAIVWRDVATAAIAAWLVAVLLSREWRARALARLVANPHGEPIAQRLRSTVRWNLLLGACNGSAALFMLALPPTLDAVLTMILVSWGAGAVSTSATVFPAFLAYASLLFVPTAAMWALSGSWLGAGVAALVLMFFGVQIGFARRNLQTFDESFAIRLENVALAQNLEHERAQLALARDQAVKANLEKSRFLAAASHDLRQPLQALSLNTGALVRQPLDAQARAIAGEISTGLETLRSMLDGMLDVSKLDAGVVMAQSRRVQLGRLVDAVAASFRPAAEERGLQLITSPSDIAVVADPDLLRRLIANLVDNAIKFTPSGSVTIAVHPIDSEVELTVSDTGPGIAPEHHRLIFEDLVQLDGARAAVRGHGLGLGIVRRLAALMGLRVDLDSALGAGATFKVRLPRAGEAASDTDGDRAAPDSSLAGCRVLVLDDDSMVRGAYVNALGALGCRVVAAATIAEALARCADGVPDAAVVDYRLDAGEEGFDAIARLRLMAPDLPAVMVTADTDPAISAAAARHHVVLLHKPVDEGRLGAAVAALVEAR